MTPLGSLTTPSGWQDHGCVCQRLPGSKGLCALCHLCDEYSVPHKGRAGPGTRPCKPAILGWILVCPHRNHHPSWPAVAANPRGSGADEGTGALTRLGVLRLGFFGF